MNQDAGKSRLMIFNLTLSVTLQAQVDSDPRKWLKVSEIQVKLRANPTATAESLGGHRPIDFPLAPDRRVQAILAR